MILVILGIIGEYVGRIYDETKARPLYIVRECVGLERGRNASDSNADDSSTLLSKQQAPSTMRMSMTQKAQWQALRQQICSIRTEVWIPHAREEEPERMKLIRSTTPMQQQTQKRITYTRLVSFFRFTIVGVLNTAIDYTIFLWLSWAGVSIVPAQALSYSAGTLNSYLLNQNWTFRERNLSGTWRAFVSFIVLNLITLGCTTGLLSLLNRLTDWTLPICKLLATLAGLIINHTGSRLWVFVPRNVDGEEA